MSYVTEAFSVTDAGPVMLTKVGSGVASSRIVLVPMSPLLAVVPLTCATASVKVSPLSAIASSVIVVRIWIEEFPAAMVAFPVNGCHALPSKNSSPGPKSLPWTAETSANANDTTISSTLGLERLAVKTANGSVPSVAITLSILIVGRSSSLPFGPVPSSIIVPTPTPSKIVAPLAPDRFRAKEFDPSNKLSSVIATVTVCV